MSPRNRADQHQKRTEQHTNRHDEQKQTQGAIYSIHTHLEKTSFGRKGVDSAIVFGSGEIHSVYILD